MSGIVCYDIIIPETIKARMIDKLKFETEIDEFNDTKVFFEDKLLCWIGEKNIESFAKDFYRVIKKYAI